MDYKLINFVHTGRLVSYVEYEIDDSIFLSLFANLVFANGT